MAHYEPPHQDLRCLQIQLFSSLVVKELNNDIDIFATKQVAQNCILPCSTKITRSFGSNYIIDPCYNSIIRISCVIVSEKKGGCFSVFFFFFLCVFCFFISS